MATVAQLHEHTKNQWVVHFKQTNYMVCDVYLSEAMRKKKRLWRLAQRGGEMWTGGWNTVKVELTDFVADWMSCTRENQESRMMPRIF